MAKTQTIELSLSRPWLTRCVQQEIARGCFATPVNSIAARKDKKEMTLVDLITIIQNPEIKTITIV
jgi:hypothetical protein